MLRRCLLAALFVLLAAPAQAQDCRTIAEMVEQAVSEEADAYIEDQFSGGRAVQLVRTIREFVADGDRAIADQILAFGAPDLPLKSLIGFHHGCFSFRLGLTEPGYRDLLRIAFGDPA